MIHTLAINQPVKSISLKEKNQQVSLTCSVGFPSRLTPRFFLRTLAIQDLAKAWLGVLHGRLHFDTARYEHIHWDYQFLQKRKEQVDPSDEPAVFYPIFHTVLDVFL